jgi:hypothetical protein
MSDVLMRLAMTLLKEPPVQSPEAAHAALLMAHIGWNHALGHPKLSYDALIQRLQASNPDMWSEFHTRDCDAMIESIVARKRRLYPNDRRIVVVCGILEGPRLQVEWCEEDQFPEASRQVAERFGVRLGDPGTHAE